LRFFYGKPYRTVEFEGFVFPLEREIHGYLEKIIQIPMTQDRSTKIIWMIQWIRISRL
jgi:hypothetical protein